MSTRTKLLGGVLAAIVALAAAGAGFWYFVLRSDAPPEVSLSSAVDSLSTPGSGATASPSADTTSAQPGLDGTWNVSDQGETFVGYRVGEELANVGTTTAVGRTTGVTAEFVVADGKLKSGQVEADLTRLQSDKSQRDGQLRTQALETNQFPTATFKLTQEVALPDSIESGNPTSLTLKGELTLHGVTRAIDMPLEVQLVDGRIVAVGSIDIVFADYDIDQPRSINVLSVQNHGIMELQIILAREGSST